MAYDSYKDPEARRAYHKAYMKKRYHEDPEHRAKHIARVRKNTARRDAEFKALIEEFRSGGCSLCPEVERCCLVAHHRDPSEKDFTVSRHRRVRLEKVRQELEKCVCLCMNCHAKVHADLLAVPDSP